MARPRSSIPTLRFHKSTGQWYYYTAGRRVYLGKDLRVAEQAYRQVVANGATDPAAVEAETPGPGCTLAEALVVYRIHAAKKYTDQRAIARVDAAIDAALARHPSLIVSQFRPRHLRDIRDRLLERRPPLARGYVNALVRSIKTAIGWLVQEEIMSPTAFQAARSLQALRPGEGGREPGPVPAVDDWIVNETMEHTTPTIRAMIQIQRATGMRPSELCEMKRFEVSTRPDEPITVPGLRRPVCAMPVQIAGAACQIVWLYGPSSHKNVHRGKVRVVAIGPDAQRHLSPILQRRAADDFVFQPGDDLTAAECVALGVGDHYTARSYRNAIGRAVIRARRKAAIARGVVALADLVPTWAPNQLRHAALEDAADRVDAESAAVLAGHAASRRALDSYVQANLRRAAETAAKVG